MDTTISLLLLTLSTFLLCRTDGRDVNQPDTLWKVQGDDATIDCSHTKGATYYQMYWYRQLPGETMRQILFVFQNKEAEYEAGFNKDKYPVTKPDAHSGRLTVTAAEPGDNGWYFCAVSEHSDTNSLNS